MQLTKKNKFIFMLSVFWVTSAMLTLALVYDQIISAEQCILCLAQRGILAIIASIAVLTVANVFLFRSVIWVAFLGILIGLRHLFILVFPNHIGHCLPLSFVMTLSGDQFSQGFYNWLFLVGHSCGLNVPMTTYILVPMLLCFYALIIYVSYENIEVD